MRSSVPEEAPRPREPEPGRTAAARRNCAKRFSLSREPRGVRPASSIRSRSPRRSQGTTIPLCLRSAAAFAARVTPHSRPSPRITAASVDPNRGFRLAQCAVSPAWKRDRGHSTVRKRRTYRELSTPEHSIVEQLDEAVPRRDGVALLAEVYRPGGGRSRAITAPVMERDRTRQAHSPMRSRWLRLRWG